ncbi:MAG: 16S rRNA (cytidine(1402)-2'-O)-methyltransferase [Anaerolineales bacterium]|nr:16S rRNA (cytidine(1402)-2'-O)-methyltransferase [Anaerolineales bacterium]
MGTLFLVATPIGNLEDITLRGLRLLSQVGLIAAEDTRRTRQLLTHFQIVTPVISYHEHNKLARLDRILQALELGDVALVTDAGTPLISDPGHELVQSVLAAGHDVSPVPGASAVISALVVSGLPTDSFVFLGYLPRRAVERRRWLRDLAHETKTLVLFEAPHRLRASLQDLRDTLGADRPAVVCRELTKIHEQVVRGDLATLQQHFERNEPRGECTLVIAGAQPAQPAWDAAQVRQAVERHRQQGMTASQAARTVAAESGLPRATVYQMAMEER